MKKLIFLLLPLLGYSQNIYIEGYCYFHSLNDSIKECSQLTSQEIYTKDGKLIYEKIIPFGKTIEVEYKEKIPGNPSHYTWFFDKEPSKWTYYTDTINKKRYIIENDIDTTNIYRLTISKNRIVKEECLIGCDYKIFNQYTPFNKLDTIITEWQNRDPSYTIHEYDENKRLIYFIMYKSKNDSVYPYSQYIYNDNDNSQTIIHGNTGWLDNKQTVITKFDKNNVPTEKEFIFKDEEHIKIYKVKYKVVKEFSTP